MQNHTLFIWQTSHPGVSQYKPNCQPSCAPSHLGRLYIDELRLAVRLQIVSHSSKARQTARLCLNAKWHVKRGSATMTALSALIFKVQVKWLDHAELRLKWKGGRSDVTHVSFIQGCLEDTAGGRDSACRPTESDWLNQCASTTQSAFLSRTPSQIFILLMNDRGPWFSPHSHVLKQLVV